MNILTILGLIIIVLIILITSFYIYKQIKRLKKSKLEILKLEDKLNDVEKVKSKIVHLEIELNHIEEIGNIMDIKEIKQKEHTREVLISSLIKYLDILSEILSLQSDQKINVQLGLLEDDNITDISNTQVIPIKGNNMGVMELFSRSKEVGRVIKYNTDFQFICDDRVQTYFYCQDLTKLPNYQNENVQYFNFYKGKIVLPINYYGKDAKNFGYYHTVNNISFSTLGFIIASTPSDKLFTDENRNYYLDIMFLYSKRLSKLLYYYKKLPVEWDIKRINIKDL